MDVCLRRALEPAFVVPGEAGENERHGNRTFDHPPTAEKGDRGQGAHDEQAAQEKGAKLDLGINRAWPLFRLFRAVRLAPPRGGRLAEHLFEGAQEARLDLVTDPFARQLQRHAVTDQRLRQRVRWLPGKSPTSRLNTAAKLLRDMPATSASASSDHAFAGSAWITASALLNCGCCRQRRKLPGTAARAILSD